MYEGEDKTTHFVYLFASSQNRDIGYSIQSIKKFWRGDFKIFVIGYNSGIKGVKHIHEPIVDSQSRWWKQMDTNHKKKVAAQHDKINDDFIVMHDDMVFLKPTHQIKRLSREYVHDLARYDYKRDGIDPSAAWRALVVKTMKQLRSEDLPMYNYETHYPRVYNKDRILSLFDKYNLDVQPFNFASLYFNNFFDQPEDNVDKYSGYIYHPHHNLDRIYEKIDGKQHLNFNEFAITPEFERELKKLLR